MRMEDHGFESEPWKADYLETWPRLALGLRRHLARLAPREAFAQILSDGNDEVLEAFLENPQITQAEVLTLIDRARSRRLLEIASRTPRWYASHTVKRRLLNNAHTPFGVACRILDYLPFVELKRVMTNANLSPDVRNKAREAFRKAFMRLSEGETKAILLNTEGRVLRDLTVLTAKDKRALLELVHRPQLPRPFVLNLARSLLTPPKVLEHIARRPSWSRNTSIRRAVLANSKTPNHVKNFLRGKSC